MTGLLERLSALDAEQRLYTLETLVARLRDVGQIDRLRTLFSDDAWIQARFAGDRGVYDGYHSDLDIAWEVMSDQARKQIDSNGDVAALADCWRISLIRTSLNSIAGNYAPALVARAIHTGYWSADKAFAVIPNVADVGQRLDLCLAVLESGRANPIMTKNAQKLSIEFASQLKQEDDRSKWLVRLAPLLDETHQRGARQIAENLKDGKARAPALAAVAARLDDRERDALLADALATAAKIKGDMDRSKATTEVARQVRSDLSVQAALQAARAVSAPHDRAVALAGLVGFFSGEEQSKVAQEVTAQLWAADNHHLAYALQHILKHLPEAVQADVASTALDRVKDLDDMTGDYDSPRPVALMALGPYFDSIARAKAMGIVKSMSTGGHLVSLRASVFTALATRMSAEERGTVLNEALAILGKESFGPSVVRNLVKLIPLLPEGSRDEVVSRALVAARQLWDEKPNGGMTGEVSPRLSALSSLAPFLSGESLGEALGSAREIKDGKERAEVFLALARSLTGGDRLRAMRLSYDAVWAIRDHQMGVFAIEKIFANLDGEVATVAFNALDALPKSGYPNYWLKAFVALAPKLGAHDLERADRTIAQIKEANDRAEGYTALAANAEPARRDHYQGLLIESIGRIWNYAEHLIAYAIRDAAPALHGECADTAWSMLVKLKGDERSQAIMAMASSVRGETAVAALPVIAKLKDPYQRAVGLWRLSSALPEPARGEARAAAFDAAIRMGAGDLDGERAILELLPGLEGDQREQANLAGLKRAEYFGNQEMGARTFTQLAQFMEGDQKATALAKALTRAVRIDTPGLRAEVLGSIFSQMETGERQHARATVLAIKDAKDRFEVLASLAPFLAEEDAKPVRQYIIERLASLRDENRVELLKFLGHPAAFGSPVVPDVLRARLVNDLEEICWRWNWQ